MRAQFETPKVVRVSNLDIWVFPNVYAPGFFTDTEWYAQKLPEIVGRQSLLEVGIGTGAISIACALQGANVTACDINSDAVANAKENFRGHGLNVSCYLSDVFSGIPTDARYDNIFWAHPFNNWPDEISDSLLLSGLDHKYRALTRYIEHAHKHLSNHGHLLLGTGSSADLKEIKRIADANQYKIQCLISESVSLYYSSEIEITYFILSLKRTSVVA